VLLARLTIVVFKLQIVMVISVAIYGINKYIINKYKKSYFFEGNVKELFFYKECKRAIIHPRNQRGRKASGARVTTTPALKMRLAPSWPRPSPVPHSRHRHRHLLCSALLRSAAIRGGHSTEHLACVRCRNGLAPPRQPRGPRRRRNLRHHRLQGSLQACLH
jgi:hypothetical protein